MFLLACCDFWDTIPVGSVTIDKAPATNVYMNTTLPLKATVLPENATSKDVSWTSSDNSTAIVAEGLVTPVKPGEVTISATAGGVTGTCKVTVLSPPIAVTGISMVPETLSVVIKKTDTLTANILPENAHEKGIVWTSDKENIATVSDVGVVTAVALGTCTITAKSKGDPTKMATCAVTVTAEEIPVTDISVDPKTANILVNETRDLMAAISPATATNKGHTWSTSDATVAEVSSTGVVTAKSKGTAIITVRSVAVPVKTATCAVTVTTQEVALTGLTAAPADTTLAVSTSFQLRPVILPAEATNTRVTFESNDPAKASVSPTGRVTARLKGEVTITIKSAADANKTATCRLTIKSRVESITVTPRAIDLSVGQKRILTATVMPFDAALKTVTWSSEDHSKATVSATGEVTAVALGTVRIIATAGDRSNITGSATISVVSGVAGVSLEPATLSILVGETSTLTAIIAPPTATNKNVVWTSNKENIATVSTAGVITGGATGTCIITAKSASDPTKTATCTVTVSAQAIAITGISINPASASILVNATRVLTTSILPANATNKRVTWTSSNTTIAEVSATGLVTGKTVGTVTITATSMHNSTKTATCEITVTNLPVPVVSLMAAPADTTLITGTSFQINSRIVPAAATNVNVTYTSNDPAKALVSETGLVTAGATGQATITIKSVADPSKTATCRITITPAPVLVQGITVSPAEATLAIGQRQQLTPAILPVDAANKTVTWNSADPSKVTVSAGGEVTAVASGQVVITATANDESGITGQAVITVPPRATSLAITPRNPTVIVGQRLTFSATVLPANAIPETITWSLGDETKARINAATGEVLGVGVGTVTITATGVSGVTGTVTLTVQNPPPATTSLTGLTLGAENFVVNVPQPGNATTLNNAPRLVILDITSVQVNVTATPGAIIHVGSRLYTGQRLNCTNPLIFTVTEAGKSGSKEYTLHVLPYNATSNLYGIYNLTHLQDVRNAMSAGFKLMNDLTMPAASAGYTGINDYATAGWLPIGNGEISFTGTLDGGGKKIDNFFTKRTTQYLGLFGKVGGGGTIKNLGVNGTPQVNGSGNGDTSVAGNSGAGEQYTGILAGFSEGTIEDCFTSGYAFATGDGTSGRIFAGGLVGRTKGGQISRCYTTGRVGSLSQGTRNAYAGGITGSAQTTIIDCYTTGEIFAICAKDNSTAYAGGLVGDCQERPVSRCYATGRVGALAASTASQQGAYAGGLIAHITTQVNNCYATGKVLAAAPAANTMICIAGGLVGHGDLGSSISNSYSVGEVEVKMANYNFRYVGGFVGYSTTTDNYTNCYRNWDASVLVDGSEKTPNDKGTTGISAEYLADMKKSSQRDKLNQGQTAVWGHGGGKNNDLPYLIGVGVGK